MRRISASGARSFASDSRSRRSSAVAGIILFKHSRADGPNAGYRGEQLRMERVGDGTQAADHGRSGSVEQFVGDAEDARVLCRRKCGPLAVLNNLFQRHAVPGAAPRGQDDVGTRITNEIRIRRLSRTSYELSPRGFDQLGDPSLRRDDRLPPFFTPDSLLGEVASS